MKEINVYLQPLIQVGIFRGIFTAKDIENDGTVDSEKYLAAANEFKEIAIKIFGQSYFHKLYDFFKSKLLYKPNEKKVIFALSKKGFFLARIFFAYVAAQTLQEDSDEALEQIKWGNIEFFSDRSVELHAKEIKQAKSILILDETVIYGRSLMTLSKRILDIINPNSDEIAEKMPELYVFSANLELVKKSYDMSEWEKYEAIPKENSGVFKFSKYKKNGKSEAFKINYYLLSTVREQKDFLYKTITLFCAIGIPFTATPPVYFLDKNATEAVLKLIGAIGKSNEYNYFKYSFFENYGINKYIAYKKGEEFEGMPACFRLTVNIDKNISYISPVVPSTDIATQGELSISKLFDEVFSDESVKTIKEEANKEGDLSVVKYSLAEYFVQCSYIMKEIFSKLEFSASLEDDSIRYIGNGNNQNFNPTIEEKFEELQKDAITKVISKTTSESTITKIGSTAVKLFVDFADPDITNKCNFKNCADIKYNDTVESRLDIFNRCTVRSCKDDANSKCTVKSRANYKKTIDDFVKYVENNNSFIKDDCSGKHRELEKISELFKADPFDSLMQIFSMIEDRELDVELIKNRGNLQNLCLDFCQRSGYLRINYLIAKIKEDCKINIDRNYVLANLIERLEFGITTLKPRKVDRDGYIRMVCRAGEAASINSAGSLPHLATATALFENIINSYLVENIDLDLCDSNFENYNNFSKGEVFWNICYEHLVKRLLKYLEENKEKLRNNKIFLTDAKTVLTQDAKMGGFSQGTIDNIKGYNIKLLRELLIPKTDLEQDEEYANCIAITGNFGRYCDEYLYSNDETLEEIKEDLHKKITGEELKTYKVEVTNHLGEYKLPDYI